MSPRLFASVTRRGWGWVWQMRYRHPGDPVPYDTRGVRATRGQAIAELRRCVDGIPARVEWRARHAEPGAAP
jgi:hypothetical protein